MLGVLSITAALLFFSQTTLWTNTESLHVLHPPIFSVALQNILVCSLSIDSARFVKFMLLQAMGGGEEQPPKNRKQGNYHCFLLSPFKQTLKMNSPKEKKPQEEFRQTKNLLAKLWISIHNTLLKEAPEGQGGIEKQEPWRKNGFKQKRED